MRPLYGIWQGAFAEYEGWWCPKNSVVFTTHDQRIAEMQLLTLRSENFDGIEYEVREVTVEGLNAQYR